jgi:hypothetical protein
LRDAAPTPGVDLAACLLLAGGLKPSPLVAQTGGSVLDLYLRPDATVLSFWLDRFQELAPSAPGPVIHIAHGASTPAPNDMLARRRGYRLRVEEDRQEFRGPAGAVKDACADYSPGSMVLVAEAARFVAGDLSPMLAAHVQSGADITVGCNPDSSPAGLFLIRCKTLTLVPPIGFMDLKEQWLGKAVEAGLNVRVHRLRDFTSYELRTRTDFLAAARAAGGIVSATLPAPADVHVNGSSANEEHALPRAVEVGVGAVIVDSVIMPGAQIGKDAVVARSIVCPGGVVPPGAAIVDAVVPSSVFANLGGLHRQEVHA